jgi:AraC-like DNA-binding protein
MKRPLFKCLSLLSILFLGCGSSLAAQIDTVKINADTFRNLVDLYPTSQFYLDESDTLSVDQVLLQEFTASQNDLRLFSENAYWFKTEIKNESTSEPINALICGFLNTDIDFFIITENTFTIFEGGQWINYRNRAFNKNPCCLPIEIAPGQSQTYLVRYRSFFNHFSNRVTLKLKTYQKEEIDRHVYSSQSWITNTFYSSFLSILLFLVIFSGVVFLFTKEKSILFYSTYVLGNFLYYLRLWETRPNSSFLFTYVMEWYPNIEVTNGYFIFVLYMCFIKYFLDLPEENPKVNKILDFGIYGIIGILIVDLAIQFIFGTAISYEIYKYLRIGFFVFSFYICFAILFYLKNKLSKYIIIGTFLLLLGTLFSLLTQLTPGTYITTPYSSMISKFETNGGLVLYMYSAKLAILLEILFFTFGLGHKGKLLVEEKQTLQLRNTLLERFLNYQIISQKPKNEQENSSDAREAAFLQKVNDLILKNLDNENFKSQELQNAMNLSRTQLYNQLKTLTGYSASNYINFVRLNKAKELLETTGLTVTEISYKIGYGDPKYFSRKFADLFGYPPSQNRK